MTVHGADLEQLRDLARELDRSASRLDQLSSSTSALVSGGRWQGPDADRFRSSWQGQFVPLLRHCSTQLAAAGTTVAANASAQEAASAADGGALSTVGGSTSPGASSPADTAGAAMLASLAGMDEQARRDYLSSDEFAEWAAANPDAAKYALDAAVADGLLSVTSPVYRDFLNTYWNTLAMDSAGIDPDTWDTSLGTEANWDTIVAVYDYYGEQFLANPDLQWAGMANMIGPSFAGGFQDIAMVRDIAQQVVNAPGFSALPADVQQMLTTAANLSDAELGFYETTLLDMNREIFLDQARQHEAYATGGLTEIQRLADSGAISQDTAEAWALIDSGDPTNVAVGNEMLLNREQNQIIVDDYVNMQDRPLTGEAVTWLLTLAGEPSIPGAQSYPEVFPLQYTAESPGPETIFGVDNPFQVSTTVTTGLPDGNIANADDRWNLISQSTLPAYQELLATDPARAEAIIASDFESRVDDARPTNNIPATVQRILDGFAVEVQQ